MIVQVALTAIGIPVALESASQTMRKVQIRAAVSKSGVSRRSHRCGPAVRRRRPRRRSRSGGRRRSRRSRGASRRSPASSRSPSPTARRGQAARTRFAEVESSPAPSRRTTIGFRTSAVGPGFFEAFDRPMVAGRAFHGGDWSPSARTVIVNEAFARAFSRDDGRRFADRRSPAVCRVIRTADAAPPRRQRRRHGAVVRDRGRRARLRSGP